MARLMSGQLSMFDLMTFAASTSITSSQASVAGPSAQDLRDGQMTGRSGPDPAHVSHSQQSERDAGLMTSATSGLPSTDLSASAVLQLSLASKLRAKMPLDGSTEYSLTWRHRTTPSQRSIYALRASVRRTSDRDFIGWVTPSARDWKDTVGMAQATVGRKRLDQTPRQAAAALNPPAWMPCQCCEDYLCTIHGVHVHDCECPPLEEWETDPYGPSSTPSPVPMDGAEFDPAHSRWLMGFPPEWDACAPMATPSSRKSRPK